MIERQPREHPVPCSACGYTQYRGGRLVPQRFTMNHNALCDEHQHIEGMVQEIIHGAQDEIRTTAQEHLDRRRTP